MQLEFEVGNRSQCHTYTIFDDDTCDSLFHNEQRGPGEIFIVRLTLITTADPLLKVASSNSLARVFVNDLNEQECSECSCVV